MFRRIALAALLATAALSAKTHKINLPQPAQLGATNLEPGDYKLEIEGASAVLKDKGGKEIAKATKIETVDTKYSRTAFSATKDGDKLKISAIKVAGTTSKVLFE